jgi:hypothetical protein
MTNFTFSFKPLVLGVAFLGLTATALAQPRVLTVDNNAGAVAMFSNLGAAYTAARDGDTILLSGSDSIYYFQGPVTKQIHLVGNGYFLSENRIPGLSTKSAKISVQAFPTPQIYFLADAESGTSAAGTTLTGLEMLGEIYAGVPITVDRCKTGNITDRSSPQQNSSPGRVTIRRSHVDNVSLTVAGSIVHNSIISLANLADGTSAANCVFYLWTVGSSLSSVSSSIFFYTNTPAYGAANFALDFKGAVTHSMAVQGNFLPEGSGNTNGVENAGDVFIATGSYLSDAYWQLKPGSPALGKGLNGVDLGAFGGPAPYILSGVPSRPRITRLEVPPVATGAAGLRFEVDAKAY